MMTSIPRPGNRAGFTLVEMTIVCAITFTVMMLLLYSVMRRHGPIAHYASAASNQKEIALAILEYMQDYDNRFPPACGYVPPTDPKTGQPIKSSRRLQQSWGPDRTLPDGTVVPGLLSAYTKSNALFRDPGEKTLRGVEPALCYMYNDLLAKHNQADLTNVGATVLTTDAEDRLENAGHAYTPDAGPFAARFNAQGTCDAGQGASIRFARFRQSGGANFAFTDAHVQWFPGGPAESIFFPPRKSASAASIDPKTKQQIGPIPDQGMTFQDRSYTGTFHLR